MRSANPKQVALGDIRKQANHAILRKPVNYHPSMASALVPALASPSGGL